MTFELSIVPRSNRAQACDEDRAERINRINKSGYRLSPSREMRRALCRLRAPVQWLADRNIPAKKISAWTGSDRAARSLSAIAVRDLHHAGACGERLDELLGGGPIPLVEI